MKKHIILAGIALATLTPSIASAQDDGCRRDSNGRIIGTAIGAGAGGRARPMAIMTRVAAGSQRAITVTAITTPIIVPATASMT